MLREIVEVLHYRHLMMAVFKQKSKVGRGKENVSRKYSLKIIRSRLLPPEKTYLKPLRSGGIISQKSKLLHVYVGRNTM